MNSMLNKRFLKDALGWGIALWLIGYILGFLFFMFIPASYIGWFITPIGIAITLWVLVKKIRGTLLYFVLVGLVWALVAIVFDYFFLVKLLQPQDGYYKFDVYLYYILTFALPVIVGWWKQPKNI